jgi:hypothetical protein
MTRRQSRIQWSDGIAAHLSQNFPIKNPLENFSPRVFEIKTVSSSLIIFQRAELSTRSITYLCWCNWRTFWRKSTVGKFTKVVLFLHDNAPAHWALATQKKLACLTTWASNVLITHRILWIWPHWTTPIPCTKRTIEKSPFFAQHEGNCCCRYVFGWMQNILKFFFF